MLTLIKRWVSKDKRLNVVGGEQERQVARGRWSVECGSSSNGNENSVGVREVRKEI